MFNMVFVGNANVGKTTWVNFLSQSHFKVANYSGVSIDVSEHSIEYKGELIRFVDLPGLYDLHLASGEELYAKEYLVNEKIDLLVNVIDARNVKAGIHLCAQLKKLKIPMVVLLNFVDAKVKEKEIEALSEAICTPIICTNMKERNQILDILLQQPSCYKYRFFDERVVDDLPFLSSANYTWDTLLLHPFYGILFLICFLIASVYLLFICSEPFAAWIEMIGECGRELLFTYCSEGSLIARFLDALLYSFTTLFSFLPFLIFMFFWMGCLEESGYMARISYLLDPYLAFFHLSGNMVIPLLLGYGCSVPAILATRTIKDKKERKISALMIPFISCSGKIPIYLLFIHVFFKGKKPLVFLTLYGISFLISLFVGSVCGYYHPQKSFIIELPSYQWPNVKTLYFKVKEEVLHFIRKIWKIMFFVIWIIVFLLPNINIKPLMPYFSFLGFTQNYDVFASLPFMLLSKENLAIYFSINKIDLSTLWSNNASLLALCYLVYVALNIPCVMSLSVLKKEFGTPFLWISIFLMILTSLLVCVLLYHGVLFLSYIKGSF